MFYCVSIMMLGYTRINGVVAYDSKSKCFEEITPATARQLISKGMIKGIKWKNNDDKGEFICDVENWNQQNIPIKTACGKFRPMLNDVPGVPINSMCTVVRVLDTDYRGRLYEIVSNKCMRIKVEEKNLRELNQISNIAGVWITDDEIVVADGVEYEDRRLPFMMTNTPSESEILPMDKVFEDNKTDGNFMKVPEENDKDNMMPPVFEDKAPEENETLEDKASEEDVKENGTVEVKKAASKKKRKGA